MTRLTTRRYRACCSLASLYVIAIPPTIRVFLRKVYQLVFSKTRILSVKVATLVTFLSMVKTLDQSSLTQKLVPLLSKIRTKEPAVMVGTVHTDLRIKLMLASADGNFRRS